MKSGTVLLVGRPNVGKSTFVNNVIGQKIAITSPKPQTTRFPIYGRFEHAKGVITFVDTPGIFNKAKDILAKSINRSTLNTLQKGVDVAIYMIDHTRKRDFEEGKVLGLVRKLTCPKILVINKIDRKTPDFSPQYKFLDDEFEYVFAISGREKLHIEPLLDQVFELLPDVTETTEEEKEEARPDYPLLSQDAKTFVSELIREKVFLMMGEEIPYTTTAIVDEIIERGKKLVIIKARIVTTSDRYKRMLIGSEGRKIKELGAFARKEIELAISKHVYLQLTVEVDANWARAYYS